MGTTGTVGALTLTSCTFQNFFHDFTSLIGLTEGHGQVAITDTTFIRFSNCGSIVRDTRDYPIVDRLNASINLLDIQIRSSRAAVEQLKDEFYIKPSSKWMDKACASIKIIGCTFSDFNFLKSSQEILILVGYISAMKYQGLILNLSDFNGQVTLKDNIFDSLQFKFAHCSIRDQNYTSDYSNLWSLNEAYQLKSLIFMKVYGNVEISSNTFTSCNSVSGLIFLKKYSDSAGILIHSNTFSQNSALIKVNVIRIDMATNLDYSTPITTKMPCAGVQISNNIFTRNIGWQYTGAAIYSSCFSTTEIYNYEYAQTSLNEPFPMSKIPSENLQKTSVLAFTEENTISFSDSGITIDINKHLLKDNIFTENFAGKCSRNKYFFRILRTIKLLLVGMQSSIVYMQNVRAVHMQNETYHNNNAHFGEAINVFGSIPNLDKGWNIYSLPGGIQFKEYYFTSTGVSQIPESNK